MASGKIIYVSTARYPTEKAYGVTISYTMAALELYGYQCRVVDFDALTSSRFRLLYNRAPQRILKKINYQLGIGRVVFNLKRLLVAILAPQLFSENNTSLWTRDPLIALVVNMNRKPSNTVIEVHQVPHFLDKLLMRIVSVRHSVILAPISIDLQNRLMESWFKFRAQSIILCPMGVPEAFFKARTKRPIIDTQNVRITYVGGLTSNGIDQGIKEIICFIQNINFQPNHYRVKLNLYGLSESEEKDIKRIFPKEYASGFITTERRQSHQSLIPKIQNSDVFILPYPEGDYFNARFPLKALEYAALARPIIVSDTPSHRNIFLDDEVWFFDFGSYESFELAFRSLLENEEWASKKIERALTKSEKHSYHRRVEEIVKRFNID